MDYYDGVNGRSGSLAGACLVFREVSKYPHVPFRPLNGPFPAVIEASETHDKCPPNRPLAVRPVLRSPAQRTDTLPEGPGGHPAEACRGRPYCIADCDPAELTREFGTMGQELWEQCARHR